MGKTTFRIGASEGLRKKEILGTVLLVLAGCISLYMIYQAIFIIREFQDYYINDVPMSRYGVEIIIVCLCVIGILVANLLCVKAANKNIPKEIIIGKESIDINASLEYHFSKNDIEHITMSKSEKRGTRKLIIFTSDSRILDFSLGLGKSMFKDAVTYQYAELREAIIEWCDKNGIKFS